MSSICSCLLKNLDSPNFFDAWVKKFSLTTPLCIASALQVSPNGACYINWCFTCLFIYFHSHRPSGSRWLRRLNTPAFACNYICTVTACCQMCGKAQTSLARFVVDVLDDKSYNKLRNLGTSRVADMLRVFAFCADLREVTSYSVLQNPAQFVAQQVVPQIHNRSKWVERGLSSMTTSQTSANNAAHTQRTQSKERKERNGTDVRHVTQWRHYWMGGLLQAAAANHSRQRRRRMPSCGRHAIKYEIIEIKFNLHLKLHNK